MFQSTGNIFFAKRFRQTNIARTEEQTTRPDFDHIINNGDDNNNRISSQKKRNNLKFTNQFFIFGGSLQN
jgi:hypothetical protein